MKPVKIDLDTNYVTKNNRKFKHNHEVKAAEVKDLVKLDYVKAAMKIAFSNKNSK